MFDLMPRATSVTSRQSSLAPVACARLSITVGRTYTVNEDVSGDHQCALDVLTLGPIIWDAPEEYAQVAKSSGQFPLDSGLFGMTVYPGVGAIRVAGIAFSSVSSTHILRTSEP